MYLGAGESKASGADVAGNAQGEREDVDFTDVWEGGEDFFSEFFGRFQVVGVDDIQVDLFSEAVCNVIFDGFSHSVFCLSHGAGPWRRRPAFRPESAEPASDGAWFRWLLQQE